LVVGQNKEYTIIDAQGYDAVLITVNFVRIEGFTIENGGSGVIVFDSNDCKIRDNIIRFNDHHGVYAISSLAIQISENTISNNGLNGINFEMSMMGCVANSIIADNGRYGLYIEGNSINNEIFENKFLRNQNGIGISSQSGRNRYHKNIVKGNSGIGINIFQDCIDNKFYHNDFIKNGQSACDRSINIWDDGEKGNYWDDYDGKDLFPRDGIGDTPYIIPGGVSQDNFPLMEPYNTVKFKQLLFPLFLRVFNRFVELIQLLDKVHIKLEH
jgi:parallel beta-helix repeat protein